MALVEDASEASTSLPLIINDGSHIEGDDGIARRTRTQLSLVDVPIDDLESFLPDNDDQGTDLSEDELDYQNFLASLVPKEPENLSFLSDDNEEEESDEAYEPEEDEEVEGARDEEGENEGGLSPRVSKRELTQLLQDCSQTTFSTLIQSESSRKLSSSTATRRRRQPPLPHRLRNILPVESNKSASALAASEPHGVVLKEQRLQLASQMHKHFQLLLQSVHTFQGNPETQKVLQEMLLSLKNRGLAAQSFRASIFSRLNSSGPLEPPTAISLRRVTRSLSAAHAAVAHPSIFEIVGIQAVDELTAELQQKCSMSERDERIQKELRELDRHVAQLVAKEPAKKRFSEAEDNLLAHGAKRFGLNSAEAWSRIQQHFLPTKEIKHLKARFKFLISAKAPRNPAKDYYIRFPVRRKRNAWLAEEDVRIVRGVLENRHDAHKFSLTKKSYLPHRTRAEIRKRWCYLKQRFFVSPEESPSDNTDLTVAESSIPKMEEFVARRLSQEKKVCNGNRGVVKEGAGKRKKKESDGAQKEADERICKAKNFHPALFFSSWAVLSPLLLLHRTCEHNWPESMEKHVDLGEFEESLRLEECVPPTQRRDEAHGEVPERTASVVGIRSQKDQSGRGDMDAEVEEEEGDDSDYEHDVLLSSSEEDSEEEYERVELSDDENGARELSSVVATPVQHPLRLRDLPKTDEKARRALEALERRITGRPLAPTPPSPIPLVHSPPSSQKRVDISSSDDDGMDFECEELLPSSSEEETEIREKKKKRRLSLSTESHCATCDSASSSLCLCA